MAQKSFWLVEAVIVRVSRWSVLSVKQHSVKVVSQERKTSEQPHFRPGKACINNTTEYYYNVV